MRLWTFGLDDGYRLGHSSQNKPGYVNIPEGSNIIHIAFGWKHAHFVNDKHQVFSWGSGLSWRLGTGDKENQLNPIQLNTLPPGIEIKQICCGDKYSALLTMQGQLFVWGAGYSHVPTILDVSSSVEHIACGQIWLLAALQDGSIIQFYRHSLPVQLRFPGEKIIQVACGQNHKIALSSSGHVYSWGSSSATGQGNIERPRIIEILNNVNIVSIYSYNHNSF